MLGVGARSYVGLASPILGHAREDRYEVYYLGKLDASVGWPAGRK
jgi:hypothetical protein